MVLNFFGRGSGFADEHTSAYFSTENKEMVIHLDDVVAAEKIVADYPNIEVVKTV